VKSSPISDLTLDWVTIDRSAHEVATQRSPDLSRVQRHVKRDQLLVAFEHLRAKADRLVGLHRGRTFVRSRKTEYGFQVETFQWTSTPPTPSGLVHGSMMFAP